MKSILSILILFCFPISYGQCSATINSTNIACNGACDGFIQTIGTGATPIDYVWSSGDNSSVITEVCASTYYLTMTDDTGCVYLDTVVITEPQVLESDPYLVSGTSGPGQNDGIISSNVTGGTPPYTQIWYYCGTDTVYPQWMYTYFPTGDFYFIVEDDNGCLDTSDCVTVTEGTSSIENINDFQFDLRVVNSTLKFNSEIDGIFIFDASGNLLVHMNNLCQTEIDCDFILNSGIYMVVAKSVKGTMLRKKVYLQE